VPEESPHTRCPCPGDQANARPPSSSRTRPLPQPSHLPRETTPQPLRAHPRARAPPPAEERRPPSPSHRMSCRHHAPHGKSWSANRGGPVHRRSHALPFCRGSAVKWRSFGRLRKANCRVRGKSGATVSPGNLHADRTPQPKKRSGNQPLPAGVQSTRAASGRSFGATPSCRRPIGRGSRIVFSRPPAPRGPGWKTRVGREAFVPLRISASGYRPAFLRAGLAQARGAHAGEWIRLSTAHGTFCRSNPRAPAWSPAVSGADKGPHSPSKPRPHSRGRPPGPGGRASCQSSGGRTGSAQPFHK